MRIRDPDPLNSETDPKAKPINRRNQNHDNISPPPCFRFLIDECCRLFGRSPVGKPENRTRNQNHSGRPECVESVEQVGGGGSAVRKRFANDRCEYRFQNPGPDAAEQRPDREHPTSRGRRKQQKSCTLENCRRIEEPPGAQIIRQRCNYQQGNNESPKRTSQQQALLGIIQRKTLGNRGETNRRNIYRRRDTNHRAVTRPKKQAGNGVRFQKNILLRTWTCRKSSRGNPRSGFHFVQRARGECRDAFGGLRSSEVESQTPT